MEYEYFLWYGFSKREIKNGHMIFFFFFFFFAGINESNMVTTPVLCKFDMASVQALKKKKKKKENNKRFMIYYSALCLPDFVIHVASAHFADVCWPLWPKKY